jgi:xanthine dehydrogenase large subunit
MNRIVGQALRHDSALAHASGGARFLDDLAEPAGLWHAALVTSPVAHGRLLGLDAPPGRPSAAAR